MSLSDPGAPSATVDVAAHPLVVGTPTDISRYVRFRLEQIKRHAALHKISDQWITQAKTEIYGLLNALRAAGVFNDDEEAQALGSLDGVNNGRS